MSIRVRLYLEDFRFSHGQEILVHHMEKQSMAQLLNFLEIPANTVWLITANDQHVDLTYLLQSGDAIALYAPVGGG